MDCPNCAAPHPDAALFCARCGTPLHPVLGRSGRFVAHREEPVRALAVMSTLMPHLAGGRHHIYRGVVALALLAALIAAAFGMLSIALVLAAIALPTVVLTYIHDHDVWRREPITVVGVAFGLALVLGVGVGLLEHYFTKPVLLEAPSHRLPTPNQIFELGVLIPIVSFAMVLIAPMLITARSAFRHPVDAAVICTLSGAAFSLGLSVVVQRGAFAHLGATAGDPAHVAFIAFTLGFLQPIIFATAAAMAVVPLRGVGVNTASGVGKGLLLVVLYELATVMLTPYGTRGIVLTTLAALVLAAAGLLGTRDTLHTSLLAEAQAALSGGRALNRAPDTHQVCAHCGAAIGAGAAFCQACGTATAALARHPAPDDRASHPHAEGQNTTDKSGAAMSSTPAQSSPPLQHPGDGQRIGHRLHPLVIAVIVAVVILIVAAVTAAIVFSGTTNPPRRRPMLLPSSHATTAAHAGAPTSLTPPDQSAHAPKTARGGAITLTAAQPIHDRTRHLTHPRPGLAACKPWPELDYALQLRLDRTYASRGKTGPTD